MIESIMDCTKDNDWNPCCYVHKDKLESLTHEVNTEGNKGYYISFPTEHVYNC